MSRTEIVNDRIMWVFSQMNQSSNVNSSELFVGLTAGASASCRSTFYCHHLQLFWHLFLSPLLLLDPAAAIWQEYVWPSFNSPQLIQLLPDRNIPSQHLSFVQAWISPFWRGFGKEDCEVLGVEINLNVETFKGKIAKGSSTQLLKHIWSAFIADWTREAPVNDTACSNRIAH